MFERRALCLSGFEEGCEGGVGIEETVDGVLEEQLLRLQWR